VPYHKRPETHLYAFRLIGERSFMSAAAITSARCLGSGYPGGRVHQEGLG